jgi:hypothetical protein
MLVYMDLQLTVIMFLNVDRGTNDVAKFLHSHPQYKKSMSLSKFCFISPKIAEETVAKGSEWRASIPRNKKQKKENSG